MVVDLAGLIGDSVLLASHAVGGDRQAVEEPVGDVDVVDVLLADVIATEPVEVVPVVHLKLHLVLVGLAVAVPDAAAVPVNLAADDVADHALANLGQGLAVVGLVAPLEADHHLELLLIGQLGGLEAEPGAVAIHANRLLHEDVLAGLHGTAEVKRTESGGRGEDHQVAGVDHPLVALEPVVAAVLRTVDLVLHLVERSHRAVDAPLEGVGDRGELHVGAGHGEGLHQCPAAAAAGADQADLEHVARRVVGMHAPHAERGGGERGGRGGRADGLAARHGGGRGRRRLAHRD